MKWLTLEKIKAQCRIEPDFHDEDEWLIDTGEAEEDALLNILGRSYEDIMETYGRVPAPIVKATLMLVDLSYQQRSPVSQQQMYMVPYTFDLLIKPYMRLTSNVNDNENVNRYGCKNL